MSNYDQNAANDAGYAAGAVGTHNSTQLYHPRLFTNAYMQREALTALATTFVKTSSPSRTSPTT